MRATHPAHFQAEALPSRDPFQVLAAAKGRPLHIGILSDFTRAAYANGAIFQTRFMVRELRRRGHRVTLVGPADPEGPGRPDDVSLATVSLPSRPLRSYPGLHVPLPTARWIFRPGRWDFDLCLAQTTSMLLELGVWLRRVKAIPLLCVNTTHLAAAYECLLPEWMAGLRGAIQLLERPFQRVYVDMYNGGDGLIVLSDGLARYWRQRGVKVPIHVIPRAVDPELFDRGRGDDPFPELDGPRLLVAGRMTREKAQDRTMRIFAEHIVPRRLDANLVLVGDGPELPAYKALARRLGIWDRCRFAGELPHRIMPAVYAHADAFLHASLSETFGNVLGEALWSGLPAIAFDDGMGAAAQVHDGLNGRLVAPAKPDRAGADRAFADAVLELLERPGERARLGRAAAAIQHERSAPQAVMRRLGRAFVDAHARAHADTPSPLPPWVEAIPRAARWAAAHAALLAVGRLRPEARPRKGSIHPDIAE